MEETISLKEIFEVIKKRFMLIVAFVFGAALIAAVVSYFMITPTYESSSQFIVNQEQTESDLQYSVNDIRSNVEIINTYTVILKSNAILEEVVDELNLPYSAASLADKIEVSSEEDSQVVNVAMTDESPVLATQIANLTVETFEEKVPDIMNVDNVSILTKAELSDNPSPVAPRPLLNIAIAIVLGGMVGVGLAFLLEYLDNTIRTEEDIQAHLDLPVLGAISNIEGQDIRDGQSMFQRNTARRGDYRGATQQKTS